MDANNRLKVMFIASDFSGPWFHVQFLPCQYFRKYNLIEVASSNDLHAVLSTTDADMVYMQRQYVPEVIMLSRLLKQQGKVLVTNVDDDVWHLPEGNPAKAVYTPEVLARYEILLNEVDAMVTSTPYLKKMVLPFNSRCYVERNLVEPFYNEFVAEGRDKDDDGLTRLGWWLTPHHHDDYLLIESALKRIMDRYPKVKLIFMGYRVPLLDKFPPNRWEYYEFVPTEAFYPALASLDLDIGLAPIIYNDFNRSKTGRKMQEGAVMGIPMVVSPISTYSNWKDQETCFKPTTNTSIDWFECLCWAIENPGLREEVAIKAFKYVIENHDMNKYIFEHAAILYDIYNKVKGTNLSVPGCEKTDWDFTEAERVQNEDEAKLLEEKDSGRS